MSKFSLIYYYIAEDKDNPQEPNAFGIPLPLEEIRIADIKKNFPLEGEYYFRFKTTIQNNPVWLDITNESAKLPQVNNRILMKVLRKSWTSQQSSGSPPEKQEQYVNNVYLQQPQNHKNNLQQNIAKSNTPTKQENLIDFELLDNNNVNINNSSTYQDKTNKFTQDGGIDLIDF